MQALMPLVHTNKSPWQYHLVKFFNTAKKNMFASTQDDRRREQQACTGHVSSRLQNDIQMEEACVMIRFTKQTYSVMI